MTTRTSSCCSSQLTLALSFMALAVGCARTAQLPVPQGDGQAGQAGHAGTGAPPSTEDLAPDSSDEAAYADGSAGSSWGGAAGSYAGQAADAPAVLAACPCTRRPQGKVHHQCPRGTGAATTTVVPSGGGTAFLEETVATRSPTLSIQLAPNALKETVALTITEATEPPPADFIDFSPVYELSPLGLDFGAAASLKVPWQSSLTEIDLELSVYYARELAGPYERLDDSYINAGFSQATLPGTGYFFVGHPKPMELAHCE